jgi:hypothetical protein
MWVLWILRLEQGDNVSDLFRLRTVCPNLSLGFRLNFFVNVETAWEITDGCCYFR